MNAPRDILAPSAALRRLADFLHESGNQMPPAEAATLAINQWIAAAQSKFTNLAPTPARGYQWKSLFLPEATELRMSYGGRSYYARVRLPADTRWRPASLLRRQAGLEAMTAAAACMSETLKTALALVDHAGALALPQYERRTDQSRRTSDRLAGACAFD